MTIRERLLWPVGRTWVQRLHRTLQLPIQGSSNSYERSPQAPRWAGVQTECQILKNLCEIGQNTRGHNGKWDALPLQKGRGMLGKEDNASILLLRNRGVEGGKVDSHVLRLSFPKGLHKSTGIHGRSLS